MTIAPLPEDWGLQFPLALQWSLMDEYTTLISLLLVVVVLVILIASRI
jgi:hypothetical protein